MHRCLAGLETANVRAGNMDKGLFYLSNRSACSFLLGVPSEPKSIYFENTVTGPEKISRNGLASVL